MASQADAGGARTGGRLDAAVIGSSRLTATALPDLSRTLAERYDVVREVGRGGMATVYLATDRKHDRAVALKVLLPDVAASLGAERFLREIHLLARLQHPHILPLYDSGEVDGLLYFVMPFVDGDSLRERLRRDEALTLAEASRVLRQLADALDYAHELGVVHRDLKPENVLLSRGQALLADFGIARVAANAQANTLTAAGVTLGTPAYMSPEQSAADPDIDSRSDVYSLGCVLYEMLVGNPPFAGPTVMAFVRQHLTAEPPPAVGRRAPLPEALPPIVARALAKDPSDRFPTAGALAEAVERALVQQHAIGEQSAASSPADKPRRQAVLVLEFTNIIGTADADWLATGIAETVSADLRRVSSVRLIPQDPPLRRRIEGMRAGRPVDERLSLEIGRGTGADWVVWGSYQKVGSRLRIMPSFSEIRREAVRGGPKLDGTMDEVFDLQDRIITSLTDLLQIPLTSGEVASIRRPETSNLSAYEHYAKGYRAFLQFSKDSVRVAAEHFRAAIALDPAYAPAFIGLGMLHGPMYIATGRSEFLQEGEEYLQRGLALDPHIADAFAWLAYIQARRNRFTEAEATARRGLEVDPSSFFSWYMLGGGRLIHATTEHIPTRIAAAVPPLLRTLTINPNYHASIVLLVAVYQIRGQYGHARALSRRGLTLEQAQVGLQFIGSRAQEAALLIGAGDLAAARQLLEEAVTHYEGADHVYAEAMAAYARWLRGCVAEREGAMDRARAEFERACEIAERNPHRISIGAHWVKARSGIARILHLQGSVRDAESALADATRVFRERSRFIWSLFIGALDAEVLYDHAATLATFGREDDALSALREAADAGWADLTWLYNDPAFIDLREQPAFRAVCSEAAARVELSPPVGPGGLE